MKKLIIFEGIDGSGKTTQAKYFAKKLKAVYLKEPFYFKNQILKNNNPLAEIFLFLADRAKVYELIKKFLKTKNVILDRSFPSTLAYQLKGRNLERLISLEDYLKIDLLARNKIEPHLVFILDLSPKIALSRFQKKSKFENEKLLTKVRKAYLDLAKEFDWFVIDAAKSKKEVKNEILLILKEKDLLK
jgi:dTMP kinase